MSEPPRSPRRHLRLNCTLATDAGALAGRTENLAPSDLHVRLARTGLDDLPLEVGRELRLRLNLPDRVDRLEGRAEVVWLRRDEVDVDGAQACGVGLRLLAPDVAHQLERFVQSFRYTVVVADAEYKRAAEVRRAFEQDYRMLVCTAVPDALELFAQHEVAALLVSERLEDGSGLELLAKLGGMPRAARTARVVILERTAPDQLLELIEQGKVFHYLRRPIRGSELQQVVHRAVDAYALARENDQLNAELERVNARLRRENSFLRRRLEVYEGFDQVIGESAELRRAFEELAAARSAETSVHIHGETGTGKELVARALHDGGRRAAGPFVAINCAGVPESLLQSTLFGHRRGAFTGADRDHPGVFEQANGGTLFLDEVAELSESMQGSLLRVLQQGEVTPLGSAQPVRVDVRVISATHADLRELVKQGQFREDLFFRLVVLSVRLPPLRERTGDIRLLARHFLALHQQHLGKRTGDLAPETLKVLEAYSWPGNVRELENEIERLVVLSDEGAALGPDLLSPTIRTHERPGPAAAPRTGALFVAEGTPYDAAIDAVARHLVTRALERSGGSVSAAADQLKMERSRLGKLRSRLGLV